MGKIFVILSVCVLCIIFEINCHPLSGDGSWELIKALETQSLDDLKEVEKIIENPPEEIPKIVYRRPIVIAKPEIPKFPTFTISTTSESPLTNIANIVSNFLLNSANSFHNQQKAKMNMMEQTTTTMKPQVLIATTPKPLFPIFQQSVFNFQNPSTDSFMPSNDFGPVANLMTIENLQNIGTLLKSWGPTIGNVVEAGRRAMYIPLGIAGFVNSVLGHLERTSNVSLDPQLSPKVA